MFRRVNKGAGHRRGTMKVYEARVQASPSGFDTWQLGEEEA